MGNNCVQCRFKQDPTNQGHCYMFQSEPEVCGVWRKADIQKLGAINAEDTVAEVALSAAELKRQRKAAKRLGVK